MARHDDKISREWAARIGRDWAEAVIHTQFNVADYADYLRQSYRPSARDKSGAHRSVMIYAPRPMPPRGDLRPTAVNLNDARENEIVAYAIRRVLLSSEYSYGDALNAVVAVFPGIGDCAPAEVFAAAESAENATLHAAHEALAIADDVRFKLMSDSVKAGLDRARERGVKLGRPVLSVDPQYIHSLKADGLSIRKIALETGLSVGTVHNILHSPVTMDIAVGDCPF